MLMYSFQMQRRLFIFLFQTDDDEKVQAQPIYLHWTKTTISLYQIAYVFFCVKVILLHHRLYDNNYYDYQSIYKLCD